MKKGTKKTLYTLAGLAALAGGAYLIFRERNTTATPPPPPFAPGGGTPYTPPATTPDIVTPPPTTTTTTAAPLKAGDIVKTTTTAHGYTGAGVNTPYTEGGTDGTGQIEAGNYAGEILSINTTFHTALLRNYTTPMKYGTTNIYDFWIPINWLKK